MNYKTTLSEIRSLINYFKTYQLKINGGITRDLLSSDNEISPLTLLSIGNAVNSTPKYLKVASKKKSVNPYVIHYNMAVFPDNQKVGLVTSVDVDQTKVALLIVDDNKHRIDARVSGGGYSEDYINANFSNNIFAPSFLDAGYGDGMPLAASASIMVELPDSILATHSEQEIRDAVTKYSAAGLTPIIAYYA